MRFCLWMCVWLLSLAFLLFFVSVFLKHGHLPVPTEPEASKNWFSTSVCVWSVLVLFQHNHFVGKLVPFNCSCRTTFFLFLLVSSFSNKDWTFKTTTLCCLYCLFFLLSVIRVFFLPCHKYIIVKKLETLIPLTYMYDHKVAY